MIRRAVYLFLSVVWGLVAISFTFGLLEPTGENVLRFLIGCVITVLFVKGLKKV